MTPPLSYLEFVAAFVAAPVLVLLALGTGIDRRHRRTALAGVALLVAVALSYTTPWDNYLIARDVWWYGAGTVAFRVWNAPIEEYAFVALQTVLVALWLYRRPLPLPTTGGEDRLTDRPVPDGAGGGAAASAPATGPSTTGAADGPAAVEATDAPAGAGATDGPTAAATADLAPSRGPATDHGGSAGTASTTVTGDSTLRRQWPAVAGALAWLAVAGLGALALSGRTFYLGAILAWAGPVLALQWAVGGRYLLSVRRHLLAAVLPPTAYLCLVDRLAIGWGLWTIAPGTSTGLTVAGLPVEEATFFLLTTLLVVQGLVLLHWVLETRPWAVPDRP